MLRFVIKPGVLRSQSRIYQGGGLGFQRFFTSSDECNDHDHNHDAQEAPKIPEQIVQIDKRVFKLEALHQHVVASKLNELATSIKTSENKIDTSIKDMGTKIETSIKELGSAIAENRKKSMTWIRWLVGFFGGTVVLKVLYYDVKVQSDLQLSLNKTLIESGQQIKSDILNSVEERLETKPAHNNISAVGIENLPSSEV